MGLKRGNQAKKKVVIGDKRITNMTELFGNHHVFKNLVKLPSPGGRKYP